MAPFSRALLIGSPYNNLEGTEYDVEKMSQILEEYDFQIMSCCGEEATQSGILAAWDRLNKETQKDDAVVIYYSGHGGEVLDEARRPPGAHRSEQLELRSFFETGVPWRYQFLVPHDYKDDPKQFRGILDIQISQLLRETTNKTENVTVILDCCHAGRMAREPRYGGHAKRKDIGRVHHHEISTYVENLRADGVIKSQPVTESNEHAVRICAAAPFESAHEYVNLAGHPAGVFTDSLVHALRKIKKSGAKVSWRTLMFQVQEIVNIYFPSQHPVVEGPQTRYAFSTGTQNSQGYAIKLENTGLRTSSGKVAKIPKIQAGTIAGIRKRDVFCIMPTGSESPDSSKQIAQATVTNVQGFESEVRLRYQNGASSLPEGAVAFLQTRALLRWPVQFPSTLEVLRPRIEASKFLDVCKQDEEPLVRFELRDDEIILKNNRGLIVGSATVSSSITYGAMVMAAERLTRAHHFLSLRSDVLSKETLQHNLRYEIGVVEDGQRGKVIPQDGTGRLTANENIFITLWNSGSEDIYVSIFDVECSGRITLVSKSQPKGIKLQPGAHEAIGYRGDIYTGRPIIWPRDVPIDCGPVDETLVFVVTSKEVDLRFLDTDETSGIARGRTSSSESSSLSDLFYNMSQGVGREVGEHVVNTKYDIQHFPFQITFEAENSDEE